MTSYNDGQANYEIIYDGIGNPLVYRDGWKFEWTRGRSLEKALNSCYDINYKYDGAGIRTCKTVNGVTTEFVTSGIQVLAQRTGDDVITWQIDGNGIVVGFNRGDTQYFYLKNAQGDVIGITDTSGNVVASYTYDSWGKLISITDADGNDRTNDSTHIGYINPIRYRGYYYDSETELYYLNARYYDPETGRFISTDDNLEGGLNLFAYCYNNPVDGYDPNGLYNRGLAFVYMMDWYNKYNSEYPNLSENGDCANFVSQCLRAGGFEMNDNWYCRRKEGLAAIGGAIVGIIKPYKNWDFSETWSLAKSQYEYFKKSNLIRGEVVLSSVNDIDRAVSDLNIGDIMYLQWDKDYPHHATMISIVNKKKGEEMIYYAAHTNSQYIASLKDFFDNYPGGKAYILKVK